MRNKRGFEFSFAWLFAIIIGAVIIFLSIYASTRFVKTERIVQDTELAKELGIILNPLETGIETGKSDKISMPSETRLFNDCKSSRGVFGTQLLSISTKSGIGEKWQEPGEPSSFRNKYIFSEKIVEGKNYIVFSKPFEMPFKIADLLYIWPDSSSYCLINPPDEIEDEVKDLNLNNIFIEDCPQGAKKVCFTTSGCDIDVTLDISGKIKGSLKKKNSNRVYFQDTPLFYGAIFSDHETYECQINRLMKRASELSWLYYAKTLFLSSKGCSSNLESDLAFLANKTFSINNSFQLAALSSNSEEIRRENNALSCKLF